MYHGDKQQARRKRKRIIIISIVALFVLVISADVLHSYATRFEGAITEKANSYTEQELRQLFYENKELFEETVQIILNNEDYFEYSYIKHPRPFCAFL